MPGKEDRERLEQLGCHFLEGRRPKGDLLEMHKIEVYRLDECIQSFSQGEGIKNK